MNKKMILAAGVILVFLGYVGYQKTHTAASTPSDQVSTTTTAVGDEDDVSFGGGTSAGSESINPNAGGTTGGTVTTPVSGTYKDGTYTGTVADAIYGPIQVKAVIAGGKIVDVQFLQYPNSAGHTREVSMEVMPQLKSMAIAQQSAQVDNISGATQTVDGFKMTLNSALSQAKKS